MYKLDEQRAWYLNIQSVARNKARYWQDYGMFRGTRSDGETVAQYSEIDLWIDGKRQPRIAIMETDLRVIRAIAAHYGASTARAYLRTKTGELRHRTTYRVPKDMPKAGDFVMIRKCANFPTPARWVKGMIDQITRVTSDGSVAGYATEFGNLLSIPITSDSIKPYIDGLYDVLTGEALSELHGVELYHIGATLPESIRAIDSRAIAYHGVWYLDRHCVVITDPTRVIGRYKIPTHVALDTDHFYNCEGCCEWHDDRVTPHVNNLCDQWERDTCPTCGQEVIVHDGEAHGQICDECQSAARELHDYGYRPLPIFTTASGETDEKLFLGVELEVEYLQAGGRAEIVTANPDLLYFKSDGSLCDGSELVTHPLTAKAHHSVIDWRAICRTIENWGGEADPSTCGLHIHVSRDALEKSDVPKMMALLENQWNGFYRLSDRTEESLTWCRPVKPGIVSSDDEEVATSKVAAVATERYKALNILPLKTVEWRLFSSTTDWRRVLAYIELVDGIVRACKSMTIFEACRMGWHELCERIGNAAKISDNLAVIL
jgi:hypothetical protein